MIVISSSFSLEHILSDLIGSDELSLSNILFIILSLFFVDYFFKSTTEHWELFFHYYLDLIIEFILEMNISFDRNNVIWQMLS